MIIVDFEVEFGMELDVVFDGFYDNVCRELIGLFEIYIKVLIEDLDFFV